MLYPNYISTLFDIKDAIITKITNESNSPYVEIFFILKRDVHECPCCKQLTDIVHDYHSQIIKGPPKSLF